MMYRKLEALQWFANVGQPMAGDCRAVQTWTQAVESCTGEVWSAVQLQVKNRFAREVREKSYVRSEEWNGIAAELRKLIAIVATNSIAPIVKRFNLNPNFQGCVSWDMLMICLETEFSELVPPSFFVPRLLPVYETGHFPCGWEGPKLLEGWEGELPSWRLIVY
jgi:hypothetical protein